MNNFETELTLIKDEDTRNWTAEVLKHVNEKFYSEAASTTGKYHPEYALGEGGLYRHTVAAVKIAECLRGNESVHNLSDMEFDLVIAALILHDTCKCGKEWEFKYTKHGHPMYAAELVRDVLGVNEEDPSKKDEYVNRVCTLIEAHMGQWNRCPWDHIILPKPQDEASRMVHLCDYLASRKFLEVNFDK